jgi:hypothetical protein
LRKFEESWMATHARAAMMALAAALACAAPGPSGAQNAPATAVGADAAFDSQKSAFEAMTEADRRAIQDALIWSGQYFGVVDGTFGKRTRDAIVAWETAAKMPATGLVDSGRLAAMLAAAQKARAAARFQAFTDDKSGIKIGAPLKILDKRAVNEAGGARLAKADGSVTLDLSSATGGEAKLGLLYAALTADAPGRKITLKISKPDFFIVSGEEAARKFYERMAKAPAGSADPAALRGFRFSYPAAQSAEMDRMVVAIANSFEPFPVAASTASGERVAAATATAPPTPPPAPGRPYLAATGFLVAPGQALSAIAASDCPNPTIDGKPAKFAREDRVLGLSLLAVDPAAASSASAPNLGPLGPDMLALSYAAEEPAGRVALNVTAATLFHSGENGAPSSLLASLPKSGGGSPVFDRQGDLVAIVAASMGETKLVAGVAPLAPHRAIEAEQIKTFLALTGEAPAKVANAAPLGAGEIAAAKRALVVAISCRR